MKKIMIAGSLICSLFLLAACGGGETTTIVKPYIEEVDGDLSDNPNSPTKFELGTGNTSLSGSVVQVGEDKDPDYVTITVPEGGALSEVTLTAYDSIDNGAFIAIVEGNTFSVADEGNDTDAASLLGYALFGGEQLNQNLLPLMADGSASGGVPPIGFTTPLPAGDYSFWIQQTGLETDYTLQFRLDLAEKELE